LTIKSTSHTWLPACAFHQPDRSRAEDYCAGRPANERYFLLRLHTCVSASPIQAGCRINARQIFSCQRSRLPQQSVAP